MSDTPRRPSAGGSPLVLLGTLVSDAHTWNLVYLELAMTEWGWRVVNLGPCVPVDTVVKRCRELQPDLVVISSVNGHGVDDSLALIRTIRLCPDLEGIPVVIGGRLGLRGEVGESAAKRLRDAGFARVFGDDAVVEDLADYFQRVGVR